MPSELYDLRLWQCGKMPRLMRRSETLRRTWGQNTGLAGYQRDGADFYIDLFPDPSYEIHPDGNVYGTLGCIGIQESGARAQLLYDMIKIHTDHTSNIDVNIIY